MCCRGHFEFSQDDVRVVEQHALERSERKYRAQAQHCRAEAKRERFFQRRYELKPKPNISKTSSKAALINRKARRLPRFAF